MTPHELLHAGSPQRATAPACSMQGIHWDLEGGTRTSHSRILVPYLLQCDCPIGQAVVRLENDPIGAFADLSHLIVLQGGVGRSVRGNHEIHTYRWSSVGLEGKNETPLTGFALTESSTHCKSFIAERRAEQMDPPFNRSTMRINTATYPIHPKACVAPRSLGATQHLFATAKNGMGGGRSKVAFG